MSSKELSAKRVRKNLSAITPPRLPFSGRSRDDHVPRDSPQHPCQGHTPHAEIVYPASPCKLPIPSCNYLLPIPHTVKAFPHSCGTCSVGCTSWVGCVIDDGCISFYGWVVTGRRQEKQGPSNSQILAQTESYMRHNYS